MSQHNHSEPEIKTVPARLGSCQGAGVSIVGIILALLFLANLTFGVIEIPDNLPIVGNIDEVLATGVLLACLSRFGIHLTPNLDPRRQNPKN